MTIDHRDHSEATVLPELTTSTIRFVGLGVFLAALLFYAITLCPTAYPVESAIYVARHAGMDPFVPAGNMLWGIVLRTALAVPVGSLALRANLLNVLFGAGCVWLMFLVVTEIRHKRTTEESLAIFPSRTVRVFSGLAAALFLAVSPPFWFVSTRAHPLPFHMSLLLVSVLFALWYRRENALRYLYLSCAVYGLGMSEYPAMVALLPVYGLYVILSLMKAAALTPATVLRCAGAGFLGAAVMFLAAWRFMTLDVFVWRDLHGYFAALLLLVKDHYFAVTRGAPRVGWLMILLFSVLPWFLVLAMPRIAKGVHAARTGSHILHAVAALVGVMILFDKVVAPFQLLQITRLVVTPYLLVASWFGYLAGYWLVVLAMPRKHRKAPRFVFRRFTAGACGALLLALVIGAGVRNHDSIDPRHAAPAVRLVTGVIDDLEGREWVLDDGSLDPMLRIEAAERGLPLKVLNARHAVQKPYLNYLGSLFEEPGLQAVAEVGLGPLLHQWAIENTDLGEDLLVIAHPDFWFRAGLQPIPGRAAFAGAAMVSADASMARLDAQMAFWSGLQVLLDGVEGAPAPLSLLNDYIRRHAGKMANNTGFTLQEVGLDEAALRAYRMARELDEGNISALVNLVGVTAKLQTPDAEDMEIAFNRHLEILEDRPEIWALSRTYGYINDPLVMARSGLTWAMSGQPGMALRELQKAAERGAGGRRFELVLASVYASVGEAEKSEEIYIARLKEDPADTDALMGMARLSTMNGDLDTARSMLARALDAGMPSSQVQLELAGVALLAGDGAEAEALLRAVLEDEPKNERALSLLLAIPGVEQAPGEKEALVMGLENLAEKGPHALLTLSQIKREAGETEAARTYLEALARFPAQRALALQTLIMVDVADGRQDGVRSHVERLLQVDPQDALANFVLGTSQFNRGDYTLAEASFRTSVATHPTTGALNGLGWILRLREQYEESLAFAAKALDIDPYYGPAWDTRGTAQAHLGRLDEAETSLLKAVELSPDRPDFVLDLAELYEKKGDVQQALGILQQLGAREDLSSDLMVRLADMTRRLEGT